MITYEDLKVRPFINASGTITTLGGNLMSREVLDAMRKAAGSFIDLVELNEKAGAYLARRIGVEAAAISCGAASGMQLSAAACLTSTDPVRVSTLPVTDGWKNEFIISLVDRHAYIHQGIEVCGGKLVRVGSETEVAAADILSAINSKTVAIVYFLGKQSMAQLIEVAAGARRQGIPVIVDAAAELPPRSNLTAVLANGASLVVFSGGKGIGGPQNSGLVLGDRERIAAVRMNASPQSAIGRGMKVGKEEIMTLVNAVDSFLSRSDEADWERWNQRAQTIVDALAGLPGIRTFVLSENQPGVPAPEFVPRAYVEVDGAQARQLIRALRAGEPSIAIRSSGNRIIVDPMTLQPGEAEIVGRRLREELGSRRS